MCCTSKIKLASLAHERERSFAKVSANRLLRHNCFCWKIAFNTVLQTVQLCFPKQLFLREMFFIKFLFDVVMIFSEEVLYNSTV